MRRFGGTTGPGATRVVALGKVCRAEGRRDGGMGRPGTTSPSDHRQSTAAPIQPSEPRPAVVRYHAGGRLNPKMDLQPPHHGNPACRAYDRQGREDGVTRTWSRGFSPSQVVERGEEFRAGVGAARAGYPPLVPAPPCTGVPNDSGKRAELDSALDLPSRLDVVSRNPPCPPPNGVPFPPRLHIV